MLKTLKLLFLLTLIAAPWLLDASVADARVPVDVSHVISPQGGYGDETGLSIWETLVHRVQVHPFHLYSLIIFALAITHTFFTNKIRRLAHQIEAKEEGVQARLNSIMPEEVVTSRSMKVEVLHFLGEVEVVFGMWVGPLLFGIMLYSDWNTAIHYLETRNYIEPFFVIIIMTLAATKPILQFTEDCLRFVAQWWNSTPSAWWFTLLTVGPLLGSLITEPGAMTISALLLASKFFQLQPSQRLCYATLGLLFCNVSVGGVLTHFAAPPVLMVAGAWGWDTPFMLKTFGWKAILGILISTLSYFYVFRKEFAALDAKAAEEESAGKKKRRVKIPFWITLFHLACVLWIVLHAHFPIVVIGAFFLFLGFYQATAPYQADFTLRPALLVGFFLASLVIHGGMQGWWIEPILSRLSESVLMGIAIFLTAFNDNAAVTYLTTLIPDFADNLKYAVVAGAVTGGGLTLIANAPNPAGQSLLQHYFKGGISPWNLFVSAIYPTLVMATCFALL